ncbi:MAG: prepilin peptidase [Pirellulaceae bacterium]|nr:prepilin peptidase [Pirellulaceae bacterium]
MPNNVSINGRSRCPRCTTTLKARDNFPVLGWLALGGRCRTCKLPISSRYPIVEASVGMSLALLGVAELYRLAIPYQWNHWHGGPLWAPVVDGMVIAVLIYHAVGVACCWALGLIRIDAVKLPRRLIVFAFAATMVPMLVFPTLMIVPWQTDRPDGWFPDGLYMDALMRVVTALVAAAVYGRILARGLCPRANPKLDPLGTDTARLMDLIAIIAIPSIVVGWQAIAAVIVLASLIALLLQKTLPGSRDALGAFALAMPVALTFQLVLWRRLHFFAYWPSDDSSHWVILFAAGVVLLVPVWLREPVRPVVPVAVEPPSATDEPSTGEPAADESAAGDADEIVDDRYADDRYADEHSADD